MALHFLRRYGRAAGLGVVTPHTLGHTHAGVRWESNGHDHADVADALGHESNAYTQRYLKRAVTLPDPRAQEMLRRVAGTG